MNHDIITIGGSAGGFQVLLQMVGELPADLPASLFIALHQQPDLPSVLPELLTNRGPLPARHPLHEEKVEPGHIYIAPPDNHLLLRQGFMEVVRGPRENGQRPAADALFRSASGAYGPRVVGIVLSGYLDCGTAGMMSIKARGGLGVVQDPASALVPDMPRAVIDRVEVDFIVEPRELPDLIARLATTPAGPATQLDETVEKLEGKLLGRLTDVVCPICHGVLTEVEPGEFKHYRCHVGHTFTLEGLVREQGEELERALWAAVRSLEESAGLSGRLGSSDNKELRARFAEKARTQRRQADLIRNILLHGNRLLPSDAKEA